MVLSLTKNLWDACELWVPRPIGPYQTPPEYNNEYLELEPFFHSYILAVSMLSSYARISLVTTLRPEHSRVNIILNGWLKKLISGQVCISTNLSH